MANVLLSYRNRADGAVLSGGAWSATLPLANLQKLPLSLVARSTNALAASTQLTATWTTDQAIRVIALEHHNLSLAATVTVTLRNAGGTVLDTRTLPAIPMAYAGPRQPTAEELAHYPRLHCVLALPTEVAGVRTMTVQITDTANPAGYVQLGRLWAGPAWQPSRNMAWGRPVQWVHETTAARAVGGTKYCGPGYKYRQGQFQLSWLTPEDGRLAFDLSGTVGVSGEVFLVMDPETTTDMLRDAFPCQLRQLSPLEWVQVNHRSMAFDVEEVV